MQADNARAIGDNGQQPSHAQGVRCPARARGAPGLRAPDSMKRHATTNANAAPDATPPEITVTTDS
jgi:hypothetical protein